MSRRGESRGRTGPRTRHGRDRPAGETGADEHRAPSPTRLLGDDRALRNLIGYTLTFSVIIVSVGAVATVGYGQLDAVSRAERVDNAERAMEVVAADFQAIHQQRAVAHSTAFDLSGGSLSVVNETRVRVNVTNTNVNATLWPDALRLTYAETTFTYANGALFRAGVGEEPAMVRQPTLTCTDSQAIVPVVALNATEESHFGGEIAAVTGIAASQDLLFPLNRTGADSVADTDTVNVTVRSPRADAWGRYFERTGNWSDAPDDSRTYSCADVSAVYVRRTVIDVRFES